MSRHSSLPAGLRLTAAVAEESLDAVVGVLGGSPSSGLGIRF
ncbi:MAG: hypothetical protein AB1679_35595 [Actinomycetota bacterium]